MKIIYICPGTGDAFYCENCVRDQALVSGLLSFGHKVTVAPMYLPVSMDAGTEWVNMTPVLFGAVRLYLIDKYPFLKNIPDKLLGWLDCRPILNMAAGFAGSTRAGGHEEMTISMIEGESGKFADEFDKAVDYLLGLKPDMVIVPNGFLIGVLSAVKAKDTRVKTVCLLQDEHVWVDVFAERYREKTWNTIADKSRAVDLLFAHSGWYRDKVAGHLGLSPNKISVIPFGADIIKSNPLTANPTAKIRIGYLSRLCKELGVDVLADAYCTLLKRGVIDGESVLDLCGGYTKDDNAVVNSCRQKIIEAGGQIVIRNGFDINTRNEFLSGLSVLSVPVRDGIAFGGFISEAMAAGVPVVLPDVGGFSEVVGESGAGALYSPNTPDALADALETVIRDGDARRAMADAGRAAAETKYNHIKMAELIMRGVNS